MKSKRLADNRMRKNEDGNLLTIDQWFLIGREEIDHSRFHFLSNVHLLMKVFSR